jgi:hypothetical protein
VSPTATSFSSAGSNLNSPAPALTVWTCGPLLDDEPDDDLVDDVLGGDVGVDGADVMDASSEAEATLESGSKLVGDAMARSL